MNSKRRKGRFVGALVLLLVAVLTPIWLLGNWMAIPTSNGSSRGPSTSQALLPKTSKPNRSDESSGPSSSDPNATFATADSDATQSVADSDAATGSSANKAGQLASLTESQASLSAVINELQTKLTNNEQSLSSQLESSRRAYSQLLESQKSIESKISAIQAKLAGMSKSVRVWTDASGRTVTASLVSADADSVSLLRDGKQVVIPLIKLSQADQQFVAQWSK